MTWQAITERSRIEFVRLRAQVTRRRVAVTAAAFLGAGMMVIATEALVRARLDASLSRVPTAFYTRPVSWGDHGRAQPVAFGSVDGAPMEERMTVPLAEIPPRLVQAILAVEDQRFYQHHGLDIRRIGGAFLANIRAHAIVQGGSTLTQQLAKNLFLSANRTPLRKVREAAMALVLELRYDKATILNAYLNEIYLGQDGARPIHGVGAASRYYLGRDVRHITLAEAAQLAAMISAPNRTEPTRHPEVAQARRDMVLQLMVDQHRVSEAGADQARESEITAGEHAAPVIDGRYFRDYLLAHAVARMPARGGAIYTTLDAALQRAAERAVQGGLARLGNDGEQAALVALDPRTGEILAMVGGRDYGASQFNRATDAHRQPGSAFKPIVALAALDRREGGHAPWFTLASVLEDEPLSVPTARGPWEPVDYDQSYRGEVTLREAMEESLNIPFARVGLAIGPDRIITAARAAGVTSPLQRMPSLALGSSEVTPLELARAYGVFATSGALAPLRAVLGHGRIGQPLQRDSSTPPVQVFDSAVTYLVTSALQGVVSRGTGRVLGEDERFEGLAGKTGTTSNWRDAWFITYSPTIVVAVWVGYDDGRSVRLTGAAAALPIAESFLRDATPANGWPEFEIPSGVTRAYVSAPDGSDGMGCDTREYFLAGTEPSDQGCEGFDTGEIGRDIGREFQRGNHDWGADFGRRAQKLLQRLIDRGIHIHISTSGAMH